MVTYPRSHKLRKLVEMLPLESIVLETDAPDMTGVAHQYQRNSPEYLPEVAAAIAKIRGIDTKEISDASSHNLCTIIPIDNSR